MTSLRERALRRLAKSEGGQAVLEFAIFSALFIVIMIGVSDLGLYLIAAMAVQESATEGAAYGASPGNQNDTAGMMIWASQSSFGVALSSTPAAQTFFTCTPGGSQVSSTTVCSGGASPMEYVKVTATATVNPLFAAAFLGTGTFTNTAIYRVAWKTQ